MKGVLAAVALGLGSTGIAQTLDPQALVRDTADKVLAEVTRHKDELEKDSRRIYDLVQEMVVPHFDFSRMSRSALGRYWRDASEEQRDRLTNEFRELLVRTYAVALLSYSGQQIQYLPVRVPDDATEVMIPTRVEAGGPPIPIDYRLYRIGDSWKVFDVVIDSVSMVTNYRSTFANQVRRSGIDGLIQQLADRNKQLRG
jgi:phospholipid transport system substrate-binding protein